MTYEAALVKRTAARPQIPRVGCRKPKLQLGCAHDFVSRVSKMGDG